MTIKSPIIPRRVRLGARRLACLAALSIGVAITAFLLAGAYADPAPAHELKIAEQTPPKSQWVTDEQIGDAIVNAAKFLKAQFKNSAIQETVQPHAGDPRSDPAVRRTGADALCVYALLQAGMSCDDPDLSKDSKFMKGLLDTLKTMPVNEEVGTYTRGLRATCLALLHRREDRGAMTLDVEDLLRSCGGGCYTYGIPRKQGLIGRIPPYAGPPLTRFDNSNSQYGLLGIWAAAEIGAEIPDAYWQAVEQHWTRTQCANGEWSYTTPSALPQITMTCAGVASLFVCHDFLDVAKVGSDVGREPFSPPLAKGLEWMETGDNAMSPTNEYGEYGLERVGLASGFKYFGAHDWYREAATKICRLQLPDGSWSDSWSPEVDTAYDLLFLSRGRHPILMNKLRFDHFWANRPRDAANLAAYAGTQLETVFNWQVVNLQHDWSDWTDSPILYIASHEPPKLTDPDFAKIRAFVDAGGLLFTQADGGSEAFTTYVEKTLVPKVFPEYGEMTKVPLDHPIYSVFTQMHVKPPLSCITNGARLLMVHTPADISIYWQKRADKSHPAAFELGMNMFVYAAGKRDFQNRISTKFIPDPPAVAGASVIRVARVKYPLPTWDPEPYAWKRFANWLAWKTSVYVKTEPTDIEKLGDLQPADVPLAHLTGTLPFTASPAQLQSLAKYVHNGGILFIDACGGGGFANDAKNILTTAFPGAKLSRLAASSPLLSAGAEGMSDVSKVTLRPYAKTVSPEPQGFLMLTYGKGQVIFSPQDITNGLLGAQTWGINGYTTPYCLDFMKNLVLWSARGGAEK